MLTLEKKIEKTLYLNEKTHGRKRKIVKTCLLRQKYSQTDEGYTMVKNGKEKEIYIEELNLSENESIFDNKSLTSYDIT